MIKDYTASHSLNRHSTGGIRKAIFDQRKSDYLRSTHDQPAVFIEQSKNITIMLGRINMRTNNLM